LINEIVDGNPIHHNQKHPWDSYNPKSRNPIKIPLYIDNLISKLYLKNAFIETFGIFAYCFTLAGSWFAAIMLMSYLYKVVVTVLRGLSITEMVGGSISSVRIFLDAVFNTLLVPAQQEKLLREQLLEQEKIEKETFDHNNNELIVHKIYPELPNSENSLTSDREHNENCF
jgi:hypothetical protein